VANLLDMMQAVHQVELPPLRGRERAEDGVVQQLSARAKLLFAARNDVVHLGDFRANLRQHLLRRDAAGTSHGWGFPARGQVAESDNYERAPALRPALGGDQRLPGFDHALKTLHRSGVGQIKVLQDLGGTPLSRRMPAELLCRQSCDRRGDLLLQFLETRVHEGY